MVTVVAAECWVEVGQTWSETHWSKRIGGSGMGEQIFVSFYLWFSHIATETASALDRLSISSGIFLFVFLFTLTPPVERAVLWPN